MPSGNINTVTFKIKLYAQWLFEADHNQIRYAIPSGNINTVSRNINPMSSDCLITYVQWQC